MVTREVEWDDWERDKMLALSIHEHGIGPCGFHHSLTTDKRNVFKPETSEFCYVCAYLEQSARKQHAADNAARDKQPKDSHGNPTNPGAALPSDGRRTTMRMLNERETVQWFAEHRERNKNLGR